VRVLREARLDARQHGLGGIGHRHNCREPCHGHLLGAATVYTSNGVWLGSVVLLGGLGSMGTACDAYAQPYAYSGPRGGVTHTKPVDVYSGTASRADPSISGLTLNTHIPQVLVDQIAATAPYPLVTADIADWVEPTNPGGMDRVLSPSKTWVPSKPCVHSSAPCRPGSPWCSPPQSHGRW
jgi:hypothetical protein